MLLAAYIPEEIDVNRHHFLNTEKKAGSYRDSSFMVFFARGCCLYEPQLSFGVGRYIFFTFAHMRLIFYSPASSRRLCMSAREDVIISVVAKGEIMPQVLGK